MKLFVVFVFTLLFSLRYAESRPSAWFPQNLVDTVSNKTSQFTNYVREKGRSLKIFYVDNVKNRITSYLGMNNNETLCHENEDDKHSKINKKFSDYLYEAQTNDNKVFDSIAPEKIEYSCSENDPTIHFSTPQLIALHRYPAQTHTVETDDGYILSIHRIPYSKKAAQKIVPRKTVLLHHGLLGSSADWVLSGPEKGLAFILSDAGYDVWLANVRGNTYSRAHVSLNPDSFDFWNFTFHDISQHDLPAVIDHIMDQKGWDVKINYVGHSMGTTVLFALLSTKTQYNKVLRAGFALAPVAYMSDIKSPIKLLARFSNNIEFLLKLLGANEFLPQNAVLRWLSKHACEINHFEEAICENSLFVLCGHDEKQFNKSLLPIILAHVPAGASTKTLVHYAQEIKNNGKFQQFDYGASENSRRYDSPTPPEYPLKKITLPVALLSAQNDWLSSNIDVTNLYNELPNPIEHYVVPLKEFNHVDFLWAVDAPKLVYAKLLSLLEKGVSKRSNNTETILSNDLKD